MNAQPYRTVFDLTDVQERLNALDKRLLDPHFWSVPKEAEEQVREGKRLRKSLEGYYRLASAISDVEALAELDAPQGELESAISLAEAELTSIHRAVMFSGPNDHLPVILEINSGAGGLESEDFAYILFRMYHRWATGLGMKVEMTYNQEGEGGGVKSCMLNIFGDNAYGRLRSESGVHRLTRVSPFDKRARVHTSFASVTATPIIDDTVEINIKDSDLEWDFFRSSGAGGQAVNKVETAVRVTHRPSGLIITCQQAREQRENRDRALKMLRSKLYDIEMQKRRMAIEEARNNADDVSFGNQIRSYVLNGARTVKDHRTSMSSNDVDGVLDGKLDDFMRSYLLSRKA